MAKISSDSVALAKVPGVDLAGLSPQQAYALGVVTADLIRAAEARGYEAAIETLRTAGHKYLAIDPDNRAPRGATAAE